MAILPIITAPDRRLKVISQPVKQVDDKIRQLLDDMLETMYAAPGIGLAAIQVGVAKQAIVLDLASRRVVGWAMRETLEADLALAALRMALADREPAPGLVHHSDRGSQYTCADYQAVLAAHGLVASMSKKGDCWDNAVAESFFATVETELILEADWTTRDEARLAIFVFIEAWYNRERRHSSLGYRSPVQYEAETFSGARAA